MGRGENEMETASINSNGTGVYMGIGLNSL